MRLTDPRFVLSLQAGFCIQCCDEMNNPALKRTIEHARQVWSEAATQAARSPLERALKDYFNALLREPDHGQEVLRSWYAKWCYYWIVTAYTTIQNRADHNLDDEEAMEVCAHIWRVASNPLVNKSAAESCIRLFAATGNSKIQEAAQRALIRLHRANAGIAERLSELELRKRLAPLAKPSNGVRAVVELTNNNAMLLVFEHPNPKYGLVEHEFVKTKAFAGVKAGDSVMIEIKTDADQNVIAYVPFLPPADERPNVEDELKMPAPRRPLYNEKGERDEEAATAYLADTDEWMDEKMMRRQLRPSAGWFQNS